MMGFVKSFLGACIAERLTAAAGGLSRSLQPRRENGFIPLSPSRRHLEQAANAARRNFA